MKNAIVIVVIGLVIGGIIFFARGNSQGSTSAATNSSSVAEHNVIVVDGKQIIEIHAKGGYQPRLSVAKVGMPTVLRFDTNGTFDCSASVRIPSMNISKVLPQSGSTDIDIGVGQLGVLHGTCGMGMYPFEVNFQG